jgi:hypothetical protein
MQKAEVWAILLALICLVVIAFPTFSSALSNVVIGNTGNISTSTVTARSGSIDDLQAAINAVHAQGVGTVYVPAGTFIFNPNGTKVGVDNKPCGVVSYGGVSIIGAGAGQTILQETVDPPTVNGYGCSMITVNGNNKLPFRISGIKFQGYTGKTNENAGANGLMICGAWDYRVDNCWFDSFDNTAIMLENAGVNGLNRGVIDHCKITETYKQNTPPTGGWLWAYGFIVWDETASAWNSNDSSLLGQYYGTYDVAYIEDCTFDQCRHAVSESQNGYYVLRYCNITNAVPPNFGSIDVHGFNNGRGCEAYNNTVTATSGYPAAQASWLRGGMSTVFNNTFVNCASGVTLMYEGGPHPVYNTYIWSNTMQGGGTAFVNSAPTYYTENVNYFLYARPSYTPFTYPHPLTLVS